MQGGKYGSWGERSESRGLPISRKGKVRQGRERIWVRTYLSLQAADEQLVQCLARLVAVADILERLGRVLASDIQQNLLATAADTRQDVSMRLSVAEVGRPR